MDYVSANSYVYDLVNTLAEDGLLENKPHFELRNSAMNARLAAAYKTHAPRKATPAYMPTKAQWMGLTTQQKQIYILWYLAGFRYNSLINLRAPDIRYEGEDLLIRVRSDKINAMKGRIIMITCNCKPKATEAVAKDEEEPCFCPIHVGTPTLPIEIGDVNIILDKLRLTKHSCRRGLAIHLALIMGSNATATLDPARINEHFGWAKRSTQFSNYTADHQKYIIQDFPAVLGLMALFKKITNRKRKVPGDP
jgi:hypothetical protein